MDTLHQIVIAVLLACLLLVGFYIRRQHQRTKVHTDVD